MFDAEHIKILVIKEITGKIGPDETILLKNLTSDDPNAEEYYNELKKKFTKQEVKQAIAELDQDERFETALDKTSHKGKKFPLRIVVGATAAILVSLGIYGIIRFTASDTNKTALPVHETGITLTMPNGTKVDLSSQTGQVQVGNMMLSNNQNTLSYTGDNLGPGGMATLNVPAGRDYSLQLSDGTEIQLNSSTSITFPFAFTGRTRDVIINGEAYLRVAHNHSRQFVVHAAFRNALGKEQEAFIQVLGTEFNVNNYKSDELRVALVEGSVRMKIGMDSLLLKPGFEGNYKARKGISSQAFNPREVLSWRNGIIEFNNADMKEVLNVIPRWYGIKLEVKNKELMDRAFTGTLDRNKSIMHFLNQLKFTHNIEFEMKGDTVII